MSKNNSTLTAEVLRTVLHYAPDTGVFTWLVIPTSRIPAGAVAGSLGSTGHYIIALHNKQWKAHRLAWLYMTGSWPVNEIDHINGNRADNRFINLRDVTRKENTQNQRRAARSSKSGLLGATPYKNVWRAAIGADGVWKHLGFYSTPEEAHAAYLEAKRKLHSTCTI